MGRNAKLRSDRQLQRERWGPDVNNQSPLIKGMMALADEYSANFNRECEALELASRRLYGNDTVNKILKLYPYPLEDNREGWIDAAVKVSELNRNKDSISDYEDAQLLLLESCLTMSGCYDVTAEGVAMITAAGILLGKLVGFKGMHQIATAEVPKCCSRLVDLCWDGIEDWRS